MVRTLRIGIGTFLLVLLLASFSSIDSLYAQSPQFYASIWVDGGCGSSYSGGDSIGIHFIIETTSPPTYSSLASVSIIDHYPNNTGSQYLIQDKPCTINTICHLSSTVNCSGGEGTETLELIAKIYTSTGTITVRDTCSFYVHCSGDNTPPDISRVELVQPVDTTLSTRIPTFTWRIPLEDYQDVATWTLEYASDTQLQQNRHTITGLTNLSTIISGSYASISYTLPSNQALTNGTWYWHVSATDAAGNESAFTAVKSFVVDVRELPVKVSLVSPPNGFENTPKRSTFSWLQVQGATLYWLQVDNSSNFTGPEIDQDNITATSYMAPSDMGSGKYYWRVISNAPNAVWSDIWSFTISEEIPKQVVLLSPSSGTQDLPSTPLFQWQPLEGATSHTLEVSTNASFTSLAVYKSGLTNTFWGTASDWKSNDPSQLEDGTYYWRVTSDLAGSTSTIWNFTVKKQSDRGNIWLTVNVSNLDGDSVSGATVTLTQDGTTAGTGSTDASGRMTISGLDSGTYTLKVSASGYKTHTETVSLSANTTKDITLYRGAVIHGYVYYDSTQNPAPNVAVRVYDSQTQLQVASDVTGTNGFFMVDNVADDKTYYIVVEDYEDQKKQGIVAVDVPNTANALTIIIKTEGEIIGVVQDGEGNPLQGAKVTLRDGQGQFINSTPTNNIGSFTFKVTPGQYYIEVTLPDYKDYEGDIFTVEYKEIKDLGLITLHSKTGDLKVTVQNEKGNPLDATVTVKDAAGTIIDVITVTGGTASVEIPAGTYSLEADADKYQLQVATDIIVESGTTITQKFILTLTPGSIKVYIIDTEGMPVADAEIFLDGQSMGTTDQTGSLTISTVSPGDHTITIRKEGFIDYQDIWRVDPGETLILEEIIERISRKWIYALIFIALSIGIWLTWKREKGKKHVHSIKKQQYADKTRIYDDDTRIYP